METGWIVGIVLGICSSLAAAYLKPWIDRGKRAAKFRALAQAEATAAKTRHAAAGIKGDGFSALFLLHLALHYRMRGIGWMLWAGFCLAGAIVTVRSDWWAWATLLIVAELCFFRASYFGGKATALTEIAQEAVKPEGQQSNAEAKRD